jgi:hypothetical protein
VTNLIKILGDHLRMDFEVWEIERLIDIAKEVDTSKVITKVLDDSQNGPLVADNVNGMFILRPKAGLNDFSEIRYIAHQIFTDPYLARESAKIEIQNGTKKAGLASQVSKLLKSYGYTVVKVGNTPKGTTYSKTQIIDYTSGNKPFTIKFLENRFSAQSKTENPTAGLGIDILIIIGEDYQSSSQ